MYAAALIDRHPLLRLGLGRMLSSIPTIREVRGYAPEQVSLADSQLDNRLPVQILLFGESGDVYYDQALLRRAVAWLQPRRVLLLAEGECEHTLVHERIYGCVRKTASTELIESAVRLILAGGSCFPAGRGDQPDVPEFAAPPTETSLLAPTPVRWPPPPDQGEGMLLRNVGAQELGITTRQFEILVLRAQGMSLKQVAHTLGIAEATVKAHSSAMYRRLNVSNQIEAARLAVKLGVELHLAPTNQDGGADPETSS